MAAIEIHHFSQLYQYGTVALEDISFCIDGGVFGLLGHNGAGKTTLMKALTTILAPSAGTIRVCGFDTVKQGKEVRRRIGYLPQELAMYPSLTVFDFVNYTFCRGPGRCVGYQQSDSVRLRLAAVVWHIYDMR